MIIIAWFLVKWLNLAFCAYLLVQFLTETRGCQQEEQKSSDRRQIGEEDDDEVLSRPGCHRSDSDEDNNHSHRSTDNNRLSKLEPLDRRSNRQLDAVDSRPRLEAIENRRQLDPLLTDNRFKLEPMTLPSAADGRLRKLSPSDPYRPLAHASSNRDVNRSDDARNFAGRRLPDDANDRRQWSKGMSHPEPVSRKPTTSEGEESGDDGLDRRSYRRTTSEQRDEPPRFNSNGINSRPYSLARDDDFISAPNGSVLQPITSGDCSLL